MHVFFFVCLNYWLIFIYSQATELYTHLSLNCLILKVEFTMENSNSRLIILSNLQASGNFSGQVLFIMEQNLIPHIL